MKPVTYNVNGHTHLEPEHVTGVESAEGDKQAHGGSTVRQHVQHGAKFWAWKANILNI